jgi:hypothetical protein
MPAVFTSAYPHILEQVPRPEMIADLLGSVDAWVTDRLIITSEQYLQRESATLLDHYTAQWPHVDARNILIGVCTATYRVIGGIAQRVSRALYPYESRCHRGRVYSAALGTHKDHAGFCHNPRRLQQKSGSIDHVDAGAR